MSKTSPRAPTNWEIAVVALHNRGGTTRRVHTEDVALECHTLAKTRFSWRKYPDQPDCDIARVALSDARKPENGSLVSLAGPVKQRSGRRHKRPSEREALWMLTPDGIEWMRHRGARVRDALASPEGPRASTSESRQYARRAIQHLTVHPAFIRYRTDGHCDGLSEADFVDSLKCTLNSSPGTLRARLEEAMARAALLDEGELQGYLKQCQGRFARLLADVEGTSDTK